MKTLTRCDELKSAWRDNYPAREVIAATVADGFSCVVNEYGFPLAMATAYCRRGAGELAVSITTGSPERRLLVEFSKGLAAGECRFDVPDGGGLWVQACGGQAVDSGCDVTMHLRDDGWVRIDAGQREALLGGHAHGFSVYLKEAKIACEVGSLLLGDHIQFEFQE